MSKHIHTVVGAIFLACAGHANYAAAESLEEGLLRIQSEHNLIQLANYNVNVMQENILTEKSGLYPRLGVQASGGYQKIDSDAGANGHFQPTEVSLSMRQLVWDFGTTANNITYAEKGARTTELQREAQRSNLIMAGIESYLKLLKAQKTRTFARQSVGNIKNQAKLESARVESGKGYTTDFLQAKGQLSGAESRLVAAESELNIALNRYRAVFGDVALPPDQLTQVQEPVVAIPKTVEEALALVDTGNREVLAANANVEALNAGRNAVWSKEWMPKIEAELSHIDRQDVDGLAGGRRDDKLMLQASWQYDLGQRARHSVNSAEYRAMAQRESAAYVKIQAAEDARNAWSNLQAARQRVGYLGEQVGIYQKFLELARKEREMGRRSLLDVLSGETNLINAQGEKAGAEQDVILASFRVMHAVGQLAPGLVKSM